MDKAMFLGLVIATLGITRWAAARTRTRADFYVAHGRITPFQNGLAITGDYVSASTFLGITALFFMAGPDAFIYLLAALIGWPITLFLVGERLRNLGRFTFADACALRLEERPIRTVSAVTSLAILLLYMVAQLVGAGALIEILFGVDYELALLVVGSLMTIYVLFGGMLATTWVQIIKASLLLLGSAVLAALVLARFGFSLDALLRTTSELHPQGAGVLQYGGLVRSTADAVSVGLSFLLGVAGLPHILMRFFTVRDGRAASRSIAVATVLIGCVFLIVPVFGYGAVALLTEQPAYFAAAGTLRGGNNMAALHLAHAVGGPVFFGVMAAIAFATILAVVSGLSLTAAATISHDLYGRAVRRGAGSESREMLVSRISILGFSLLSMWLALAFEGENITFMVTLAFSIAATVNFPVLMAAMYWRNATTRGAVGASIVGLTLSITLMVLGPNVWVGVLGQAEPVFPFQYPTIVSLPVTILVLIVVSLTDRSPSAAGSRARFDELRLRALTGAERA